MKAIIIIIISLVITANTNSPLFWIPIYIYVYQLSFHEYVYGSTNMFI